MRLTAEERVVFQIAYHLRMPVYRLLREMPYEEFLGWQQFFEESPPTADDDYRASTLLRVLGFKGNINEVFPSLAAVSARASEGRTVASTLKSSFFFRLMQNSSGGDRLEL